MNRISKILAFILVFSMLLALAACGNSNKANDVDGNGKDGVAGEDNIVMSYEGFNLTENEFKCIAAFIKDDEIYKQQYVLYQQTGKVYSEADILAMKVDENRTCADLLLDYTKEFAQKLLIIEKLCADAGLSVTNQSDVDVIEGYMSDIEYAHGGKDLFDVELVKLGFDRSGIKRYQSLSYLFDLLYESRYGENGTAPVSKESVEKYFLDNYYYFDGAIYSYVDSEKGSAVMFDYSEEQIEEYFYENFVKVRHILYLTVDSSGKKLDETAKNAKKIKAEATFNAIKDGVKSFDDCLSENEDAQSEYVFTKGNMPESFEKTSFEMTSGEVRLVETEHGYHIIEKLDLNKTDLVGTVGADGKTKDDRRDTVKKAMSAERIHSEASDTVSKLNSGELKEYPAKSDDLPYYSIVSPAFIEKSNTQNATLVEMLSKSEFNVYYEKEVPNSGVQIYRRIEFGADEITKDIYASIEEKLAVESLLEYIIDYYDGVEMDNEYFDQFDIVTLPLLGDNFIAN